VKIAIVRGKHLNKFEMQLYEPLAKTHQLVGFGSLRPFQDQFAFPVVKLPSPMDLPNFPYKMPLLNRLMIDGQYLFGLEARLRGFDIAHSAETYLHFTQQCLNAKKRGWVKKVVVTVFENIPFANEGIWGRQKFKQRAIKEVDHFIAISQRSKEALILEGADPKKISIINQYIDTAAFRPSSKLKVVSSKLNILFVGRLELYKGVYEVIFAFRKLLADPDLKGCDLALTMIGDGSEKAKLLELERRMRIEERVTHKTVPYDRMPAEYQKAAIFVAPSRATRHWQEQFSTVLLEAQASGLPIITTWSGAIPENIGEAGALVQPADFSALAVGLKKFILDPALRQKFGRKSRQRAVAVFDISIGSRKLAKVYEKTLYSHS